MDLLSHIGVCRNDLGSEAAFDYRDCADPSPADGTRRAGVSKRALITGITGQDGSYLAELLLSKGYEVHGIIRRSSSFNTERLDDIYQDPHESNRSLFLHYGDLTDASSLVNLLRDVQPHEVYNLGAQSHVKVSFETPEYTGEVSGMGAMRLLEAVRASSSTPASTRRRRPSCSGPRLHRRTSPRRSTHASPYGVAKIYAYWATVNYREAYDMFAVNGILFNHESPRRGETFVTRKITRAVARIKAGIQDKLYLGQSRRDPGLGLRARVRRRHVAHAPGQRARGLRAGDRRRSIGRAVRRDRVRDRWSSTTGTRRDRPELLPSG